MRASFLAPAAILLLAVIVLPIAVGLPSGVARIPSTLAEPTVREVAWNTLLFTAATVSIEMVLGLLFALALDPAFRLRGTARAIALLPWALPTAVMAMSWRWIFDDTYGIANDLLLTLGLGGERVAWLGRPGTAFGAIVLADVWKTTPFVTILCLAGLQSVPRDLHEAMALDGAGPVRRFFWITLPLLRPALALAVTFRVIHAAGIFDLVWVLTGGGPANATKTLAVLIYEKHFLFGRSADAAAVTILAAVAMFALATAAGALARGRAHA